MIVTPAPPRLQRPLCSCPGAEWEPEHHQDHLCECENLCQTWQQHYDYWRSRYHAHRRRLARR